MLCKKKFGLSELGWVSSLSTYMKYLDVGASTAKSQPKGAKAVKVWTSFPSSVLSSKCLCYRCLAGGGGGGGGSCFYIIFYVLNVQYGPRIKIVAYFFQVNPIRTGKNYRPIRFFLLFVRGSNISISVPYLLIKKNYILFYMRKKTGIKEKSFCNTMSAVFPRRIRPPIRRRRASPCSLWA